MLYIYTDGDYRMDNGTYSGAAVFVKNDQIIYTMVTYDDDMFALYSLAGEVQAMKKALIHAVTEMNEYDITVIQTHNGPLQWADDTWRPNNVLSKQFMSTLRLLRRKANISFEGTRGDAYSIKADELSARELGYTDIEPPATDIHSFLRLKNPRFDDYLTLKSGYDEASAKRTAAEFSAEAQYLGSQIDDRKLALSAMRWYERGLPADKAYTKARIDAMVYKERGYDARQRSSSVLYQS